MPFAFPDVQRYKYRLIVDESVALGVLGARGRGAAEHFGCAAEDVEIVGGSMGEFFKGPWLYLRTAKLDMTRSLAVS